MSPWNDLADDIAKFVRDLILGDFEEQPGNAAMVVNGLIQLVPVAGQVLAARDVCGMIFRIARIGPARCGPGEWVELAIAAFGCIPEVGALFKAVVKPLWKGRTALRGSERGQAFVSAMLGQSKGAAITFIRTFDWAARTQAALAQLDTGLDLCDQLLGHLEQPRWWVPDALEGLARDMRPSLRGLQGSLRTGMQQGVQELRLFLLALLGEDGYAVAQAAAGAAVTTAGAASAAAGRRGSGTPAAPRAREHRAADAKRADHQRLGSTQRQQVEHGGGPRTVAARITRAAWSDIQTRYKGLLGEHMAHYHHMGLHAAGAWPHGRVSPRHGDARWSDTRRLVTEQNRPATPTELVPEHLVRVNQSGVDGVWSMGAGVFHFVEAKASESAGALFGQGASDWRVQASAAAPGAGSRQDGSSAPGRSRSRSRAGTAGTGSSTSANTSGGPDSTSGSGRRTKVAPPAGLTERQVALWCMLAQPQKGLQMSKEWLRATVDPKLWGGNEHNRWVYTYFAIPGASPPRDYMPAPGGPLRKGMAPGMPEHVVASAEIARRAMAGDDVYDLAIHDPHKGEHTPSDIFTAEELDRVDRYFRDAKTGAAANTSGQASLGSSSNRQRRRNQ